MSDSIGETDQHLRSVMTFYSVYLVDGLVELYALEQESVATARGGRLISTQRGYQLAWNTAIELAEEKQLPLVDRTTLLSAVNKEQ
ncbi:MAG: hypothetical protein KME42_17995 [Tildeniella nuda ZEHNDER 1965/U140]|jgi:hypothetical protein|nr:hypothetical protein [Tildeniella nuda ZEHNDER 1965/U140]